MIFRRFKKHAAIDPLSLTYDEFYEMLGANPADRLILDYIDTYYLTTMPDLDELYGAHIG